jgi:hypothetical protein
MFSFAVCFFRPTIVLKAGAAIPLRVGDIPFADDC